MIDNSNSNKRIIRNTMMLYIRMVLTMLVQLYTSRIVLQVLGITDFGIWNLVASVVVSASFITSPLTTATQRFLSFEIGKTKNNDVAGIFSQSIILYGIFCIIICILLETIGIWILNHKLQIPSNQISIANIVFQLSLFSLIFNIIRMPYDATIIACEKMNFYAYISIVDVLLKLGIVFLLQIINTIPHLILYGVLTCCVNILIFLIYKIFCNKQIPEITKFHFTLDKVKLKSLASFSGWSILGSFSVMSANQGVSMILNVFWGVVINATTGLTNQVANAINQFILSFQTAFNPQIVKAIASNEEKRFTFLTFTCCRISFCLMLLISIPLYYNIYPILKLWLGVVPEFLPSFCRFTFIYMTIDAISAALNIGIYGSGNIKNYQIVISICILLALPISYILLKLGYSPPFVIFARIGISILSLIVRIFTLNNKVSIPVIPNFIRLVPRLLIIGGASIILPYIFSNYSTLNWISNTVIELLWVISIVYIIGIDKKERKLISSIILKHK